jgi:hypothetical protein
MYGKSRMPPSRARVIFYKREKKARLDLTYGAARFCVVVAASLLAALVFALPASTSSETIVAQSSVRLVWVTSPIRHGAYATLRGSVSPAATCSITVYYKSGPSSAAGLYPKRGTRISWTWKVGTRTTPGRWPITVSCGSAGTLRTSFVVT